MDQLQSSTIHHQSPSLGTTTTTTPTTRPRELSGATMDAAKILNGDSNVSAALQAANAEIDKLQRKLLPPIPHLLSVPTNDPYRGSRPWETHRNTPFEAYEFEDLQYMTLVPGDIRGVARPRGGWEDEINARSPYNVSRSRSGTTTPQAERSSTKPRKTISLADYKSGMRVSKPTPDSQSTGETDKAKENIKVAARAEPAKATQNGNTHSTHSSNTKHAATVKTSNVARAADTHISERNFNAPQDKNIDRDVALSKPREKLQQPPASKPAKSNQEASQGPSQKRTESNPPPKRPLEKPDQSQPEKRIKVEPRQAPSGAAKGHQRNPSDPLSKLFATSARPKPSPTKLSPPTSITVEYTQTKKAEFKKSVERAPSSGGKAKDSPSSARMPEMPKLLSPLPEYLTSPNPVNFSSGQNLDKPAKSGRTSPVKSPNMKASSSSSVAKKDECENQSPLRLPELLPRELPPNVEELLAKSKPARKIDTVQARHEKSRNPDTPGVARKAPKTSAAERRRASKASETSPPDLNDDTPRLIVKLKYRKSLSKSIERILKTKPVPNRALLELADGIVPDRPAAPKAKANDSKRPRAAPDEQAERSVKRAKLPAKIDSDKATAPTTPLLPAFKSPATAPTSISKLAGSVKVTPKKGDAMKSVMMRRIDSAEDNSMTPKVGTAVTTPASTEKPKLNGNDPKAVDIDRCRNAHVKYSEMGKSLKRKRDGYMRNDNNSRMSTLAGAESLLAYVVAFDAFDKQLRLQGKPNTGENWNTLFPLLHAIRELGKSHLHLDIVILLIGGVATNSLLAVHSVRFAEEPPSNSPSYLKFRDAMSENIRRNRDYWNMYHGACMELAAKDPDAVKEGGSMAFVCSPGGQARPVKTIKVEAARMLKEYARKHRLEWEMHVDF